MIHKLPAVLYNMPRNGGTTLRMRRYNPLNTALVPLGNTGVTPPAQTLTAINIDATMSFYGTYVYLNEQVTLQNQDPVLNEAANRLGVSLRQTEDELMRNYMASTASFINCVGGVNGDSPTEVTRSDVDAVIRSLANANAQTLQVGIEGEDRFGTAPVRDAYMALGSTQLIGDLEQVAGFISKFNYPNQANTLQAEWGCVSNLRFMLSSIGSSSSGASALGANVYNIFCCGLEATGAIEQDGYSAQFIYRAPIYDGPLALNSSVGYKFAEVPRITNDQWIINMRATLSS